MTVVELGGDLHRQVHLYPSRFHGRSLRDGADKIAAEPEERLHLSSQDALTGLHRVHAFLARRIKAELFGIFVQRYELGFFGNADRSLALDVRMAANRRNARSVPADIALEHKQIDEHRDVLEAVDVLGQSHAVDSNHAIGLYINLRGGFDRDAAKAGSGLDVIPGSVADLGFELLKPVRMRLDKWHVEHALALDLGLVVRGEDVLADAEHDRDVAADLDLMILAADPGFLAGQHFCRILRVDEGFKTLFPHRIEGDDLNATLRRILQRVEKPRTVRAGVLSEEEHRVAIGQIIEDDGADTDADDLLQADRRRFVAHVGAVG